MSLNKSVMNVNNNNMLVTVAVITYNSVDTILETLNSIVNQNYGPENIELIISDDGSKDNTVKVIDEWLSEHGSRFFCMKVFANKVNSGISKNCNIAWKAATSEWIKTIAGDDLLIENALTIYMAEVEQKPGTKCFFSRVKKFTKDRELEVSLNNRTRRFFSYSAEKQYRYLLIRNVIYAPTSFINSKILNEIGYADESYRLIEDLPLWLKISKAGYRFSLIDMPLVKYRISESVSRSEKKIINNSFSNEVNAFMIEEANNIKSRGFIFFACLLRFDIRVRQCYEWIVLYVLRNKIKNKNWVRVFSIIKLASPFAVIRFLGF